MPLHPYHPGFPRLTRSGGTADGSMSLLIQHGLVVSSQHSTPSDLFIRDGIIADIGPSLSQRADTVIDASGKYVIPGAIDVHTHLDAPVGGTTSSDDFESGTRAAAFGGTTCIIDFATQSRGQRLTDVLHAWKTKAHSSTIDYGLHMIVVDLPENRLQDLDALVEEGVTSFKVFTAYPGVLMIDDATIFRILRRAASIGALVCVHAENGTVIDLLVREALAAGNTSPVYHALTRPPVTEAEAVHRVIALARLAKAPLYVVHVSSADALLEIENARRLGQPVYAETCPQYLFCSLEDLNRDGFEGAKYVLTPPLRDSYHQEALWEGLRTNALQVVSTDHCPFFYETQKIAGRDDFTKIPNGGPGIENRPQLLYHFGVNENRISLHRWVDLISTTPAKLFGLYPKKGELRVGSDADVVIWDPEQQHTISASTHHMRVDYSLYEGMKVKGNAETVIARGDVIVDRGSWLGRAGRGRFVRRARFSLQ